MNPSLVSFCYQFCMILILSRFYTQLLPVKKQFRHACLFLILLQIPVAILCACLKFTHGLLYTITIYIYFFLPCFIISQASFLQKLATEFIAYVAIITGEFITSLLYCFVNLFYPASNLLPAELIENESLMPQLLCLLMTNSLNLIILHYLLVLFKMRFTSLGNKTIIQLSFPMLTSLLLMNWLYTTKIFENYYIVFSLLYWLILILCAPVLSAGLKNLELNEMNRLYQENQLSIMEEQLSYSLEVQQSYQEIRKKNHDYANHLLTLSYLLQEREKEKAEDYLAALLQPPAKEGENK